MNNKTSNSGLTGSVLVFSLIAAIGGLLGGFHTAGISGAIGFLQAHFELNASMTGWVTSSMLIGCAVGAMGTGGFASKYGRKKLLFLTAVIFAVSSIGAAYPISLNMLVAARILGGLGVGMACVVCPMYISEISPAAKRGTMVTLFQLGMVIGILLAYSVNSYIAGLGDEAWNIAEGWRWMFASEAIPSVVFFMTLFLLPNSPTWLMEKGETEKAVNVLKKLREAYYNEDEVKEIAESLNAGTDVQKASIGDFFGKKYRFVALCGLALAIFSQVTGINAVLYYAPEIFKRTGEAGTDAALMQTVVVGVINFAFTIVSIWLIDKAGRRALLLVGSAGMTLSLGVVAYCFYAGQLGGMLIFISILSYIAFFAISLGPVTFVLISEIFPQRIRSIGMSVATLVLWVSVFIISQLFPILLNGVGEAITFGVFMVASFLAFVFVLKFIPETKGKSFKEIEQYWVKEGEQLVEAN
ncbi:sugar porter family MFS transporter [Limibacter armeniacum]|uniref:sugar porter family MFS transporter n=1 Tax=Limibacter armeniacum TaxID=466084 RepID=UPI002FE5D84C